MADFLRYTYRAKGEYWRFRHKLTGDVPLPHEKGLHWSKQPERAAFMERYAELLAIVEARGAKRPPSRSSFAWLVEQYRRSAEFGELADSTQLDYGRTLDLIKDELGEVRYAAASRAILKTVRDDYVKTIRKANKIKQMLSRLYSWADENGYVAEGFNPTKGMKKLKRKGGEREIVVWSDVEVEAFLNVAPAYIRTPVLLALYTGQRRKDVANMTWQQFQGDVIRVRQSKTTALLDIACHSVLRRHLDMLPRTAVVIATSADGRAFTEQGLSEALRREVAKVGELPANRSMHGLRYAAGSRMEEAGCTVAEIESVLGHQTFKMALKYASQRLRAKAAMAKMEAAESA